MRGVSLISACLLLAACGGGGGASEASNEVQTFYVNPTGNDHNSGLSPERPFRTIGRAVDGLEPGDVVYVAPGAYIAPPIPADGDRATQVVEIKGLAGTPNEPIAIIADSRGEQTLTEAGEVIIDGEDVAIGLRVSRSTSVILDGFRIVRARGENDAGIQVRSHSDGTIVRNCIISDSADGVRVEGSDDALIFNNLVYGNDNRGVRIGSGSQRVRLINNTIVGNGNRGVYIGGADADSIAPTDATLQNNILQDNQSLAIAVDEGPPSALVGYSGNFNLVFATRFADQTRAYRPSSIIGAKDVNLDAQFVDAEGGDFHLAADSPAIDAGTDAIGDALRSALFQRSATADGRVDGHPVDIGYHYPLR